MRAAGPGPARRRQDKEQRRYGAQGSRPFWYAVHPSPDLPYRSLTTTDTTCLSLLPALSVQT